MNWWRDKWMEPKPGGFPIFMPSDLDRFEQGAHDDMFFAAAFVHRTLFGQKIIWYKRWWYWFWWRRKLPVYYLKKLWKQLK